jgi:uncharacterized repeat protein (TIGR04076 family)
MAEEKTLVAEVIGQEGHCAAGHRKGDSFPIGCIDSGGLCGYFYHQIFPQLQTYEFGGRMPWWEGDDLIVTCPDPTNPVTLKVSRISEDR